MKHIKESDIRIVTDHKVRKLCTFADLPRSQHSYFAYIEGDETYTPRFVKYKGIWYDVEDTQKVSSHRGRPVGWEVVVSEGSALCAWDQIISDTHFRGILFRMSGEDECVVASYYLGGNT